MIRFPTSLAQIDTKGAGPAPVVRAGGTDLTERRRLGMAPGALLDLRDLAGLDAVEWDGTGSATVGAKVRVADIAADPKLGRAYPGLVAAAGDLATPQIRAVATLGGNLLQANRCWYFRNPDVACLKKGGDSCPAREGDHLYLAYFDRGPCISVHPSTLGMTLMAYDASVMVHGATDRTVAELYGDGSDATRDHQLERGAVLTHVVLPPPQPGEQAAYFRSTSRARSEWPLVEVLVRLRVAAGKIAFARVAMGGVAPVPMRLPAVEAALVGAAVSDQALAKAAALASAGASALPMTGYKGALVEGTVLETLERAGRQSPSEIGGAPPPPAAPASSATAPAESPDAAEKKEGS